MSDTPPRTSGLARLRNYFLTGFIICAPLAVTLYLTWSFINWVDSWVEPYIPDAYNPERYLPVNVPGFGLIVAIVLITLVGFLTANIVGRSVISYRGLKQILQTVLSEKSKSFQKVGLIEYPRRGLWALVFVATDAEGEVLETIRPDTGPAVAVFLPTTPNPTSGFLLFVAKSDIRELSMSVEEAAKLVISAGLVTPEHPGIKLDEMEEAAE
jgi:uncharacterized membrane protein